MDEIYYIRGVLCMSKVFKIEYMLITVGLMMIMIGLFIILLNKLNQERCYNLPLNDFYKNKSCLKYKERLVK